MTYRKHLYILLSVIVVLSLFYTGSLIFTSDFGNARNSSYVWLDSGMAARTTRIAVKTQDNEYQLLKQDSQWYIAHNGARYPARNLRVDDLIGILTARASWPLRSSNASTYGRFGLDDGASRITLYGETLILLDLLVGADDAAGSETYFRRIGANEVRSGKNNIRTYLSSPHSWYNLRLISDNESNQIDAESVQRLSVYTQGGQQIFSRRNRGWTVSGIDVANPSSSAIEGYIRIILSSEGDGFTDSPSADDAAFNYSRMALEFGNGRVVTIRFTENNEGGRRFAHVSGSGIVNSGLIYTIPSWVSARLFREAASFESQ
ncbi:MAG: DUF4340 domain-containing protein [Treponema sp.]|nr:DUF4340 domain-containing protein [Treponema sp.]MCL2181268.1 DUF4340 domain-containing protein [Treponema sp.]